MQRKRKFLLWIPVLVLLCAAFTVFCAAADETAESTDSATFIFMVDLENGEGASKITEQTYKLGETPTFSFNTATTGKWTCEIDLHTFYAYFTEVTVTKDGAESSIDDLPEAITNATCGKYVITLKGASTIPVLVELYNTTKLQKYYFKSESDLIASTAYANARTAKDYLRITYRANTNSLVGFDFSGESTEALVECPIRIDFNGQKLTAGPGVTCLYKFKSTRNSTATYFCSTRPGAEITATNATFLSAGRALTYNIGTVNLGSGATLLAGDGKNLSIACRALLTTRGGTTAGSPTCNVIGITYRQSDKAKAPIGALCYVEGGLSTTNPKLIIKDATLYLEKGYFSATSDTAMDAGYKSTLTIENSNVYLRNGVTYKNDDNYEKATIAFDTVEGSNTVIYSADKLGSLVDNKHFARCDRTTTGQITYLYQWVDDADIATAILADGENSLFEEDWVIGSTPELKYNPFGNSGSYYWYAKATDAIAANADGTDGTTYPGTLKSSKSKITGNLTLYANITFNLYFKADDYITGVTYTHPDGKTTKTANFKEQETVTLNGETYYLFKIDNISPKNLSEAFTLDVHLEKDGTTATYTVSTSLSKYASSILAKEADDDKTKAGKNLVLALLDYVYEMSIAFKDESDTDTAGLDGIKKGLGYYGYTRETWEGPGTIPTPGNITAASLKLASTPGFIFFLSSDYEKTNEINVTVNGTETDYTVTHDGDNHYFIVSNIHVSKYNEDLTVKVEGGEAFVYNLDAYMQGFIKKGEEVPAYAHALYSYVLAAQAYLATPDTQVTE